MPRNILISFLGNTNYQPTRYYTSDPNLPSEPLRFVPEATLKFHCADFTAQDEVLIFTTTEAFEKHWKDAENFK
jgi:CRISPR-associated (Cas) DxTHG family